MVQEAQGFAGVGAEIAARVQERCFHSLAAPVLRVAGFDIPYPPPKLEPLPENARALFAPLGLGSIAPRPPAPEER